MLVIDIVILFGGAALLIAARSAVGIKIDQKLKKRRQIKHGKEEAKKLMNEVVYCASCEGKIDMDVDVFNNGAWWHKECFKKTLTKEEW